MKIVEAVPLEFVLDNQPVRELGFNEHQMNLMLNIRVDDEIFAEDSWIETEEMIVDSTVRGMAAGVHGK